MKVVLTIVTDDRMLASLAEFGCAPDRAPGWVRIVDDPKAIMAIPDGSTCVGLWLGDRHCQFAWAERRERGGIFGMTGEQLDRYAAAVARFRAPVGSAATRLPEAPVVASAPVLQPAPVVPTAPGVPAPMGEVWR